MASTDERQQIGAEFLETLPFEPYPVQEEALLAWMTCDQGVLVCAPTGTGKTLIAQAALYEALKLGQRAYYTTPLIALTEQKFAELRAKAVEWGFDESDVGLVTGNRRVNPDAKVLVVVAEILLNRLLNAETFDFDDVAAVVMDEFHSFNDPQRGIVWELSLSLLPPTVRLMLLSATVGNTTEFLMWLQHRHGRRLDLVNDTTRKVPLTYHWVGDQFLGELLEAMSKGDSAERKTPALVFCFNREQCWTVAEQLKGQDLLLPDQQATLRAQLEEVDFGRGIGPKMKQLLFRGVGVHHAGMLPRYRRLVERLYEGKLLPVCVCTETLAAGINLPARSVVLTELLKGPFGKKTLVAPSTAHQIFGRAGRPQYDTEGHVYALAHEDDVRIARWREKYDAIPEGTKDPGLLKAKKNLWKKRPTRRDNQQYWNEPQFQKLIDAPPGDLGSRGPLPWRLLAYLLKKSPEVARLRSFLGKRLMTPKQIEKAEKQLVHMLQTLDAGGFVTLDPPPPARKKADATAAPANEGDATPTSAEPSEDEVGSGMLARFGIGVGPKEEARQAAERDAKPQAPRYEPLKATPAPELERLLAFRSIHPIYGAFLLRWLGVANRDERLQLLESTLGLPRPLLRHVRVPLPDELPPGPLQANHVDPELVERGLISAESPADEEEEDDGYTPYDDERPPSLAEKMEMLFRAHFPLVDDVQVQSIWSAGELLRFDGDFDKYVRTHDLTKQEGIIFRHMMRLILLFGEFSALCPDGMELDAWRAELKSLALHLTTACRAVDPESTDKAMEQARGADVVEGESHAGATDAPSLLESVVEAEHGTSDELWRTQWEADWDAMLADLDASS